MPLDESQVLSPPGEPAARFHLLPEDELPPFEQVEESLVQQLGQALQMREMSRLLLEEAGDGIYGLDSKGYVTFVNRAAREMTGWSIAEMSGHTQHSLVHHSHADGSPYPPELCPICLALRDNVSQHREDEVFWRKDGTSFPVAYTSTPILVEEKNAGAVVIFRDITQQIQEREWEKRKTGIFASILAQDAIAVTLTHIAEALTRLRPAYAVAILIREGASLFLRGESGLSAALRSRITTVSFTEAAQLCGRVVLPSTEITESTVFTEEEGSQRSGEVREWAVPLRATGGETLGALSIFGKITQRDEGMLKAIALEAADLARLALEHCRLQGELNHQAQHDALTGLPNRMLLEDRLQQAIVTARRHGTYVGVCYIDLDRFKQVNDTLGHGVGDQYLQKVTAMLQAGCREVDTVARQGGDEFILVLPDLERPEEAQTVAERVLEGLHEPFCVGESRFSASASLGVSIYPLHGESSVTLLQHADIALYSAKRSGRNRVQIFEPKLGLEVQLQMRVQAGLQDAMQKGHLSLAYQPIYSLHRELQGLEALLRWKDPVEGNISPSHFIPVAEESGLIVPLGAWVLREACRQMVAWQREGLATPRLFVNVSGVQLNREDFCDTVSSALEESGLHPSMVGLEVTETWIVSDPVAAANRLHLLREIGVAISIDDFGTGHSSFGFLQDLPLDILKIDRAFVSRLDGTTKQLSTVRAIVTLAQQLGLHTVAEGVETEQQLEQLKHVNCDSLQGFLLTKPLSPAAIGALLKESAHRSRNVSHMPPADVCRYTEQQWLASGNFKLIPSP